MDIEQAFLKDIADHPEDDAVRLVYADWLEEHGGDDAQARAALIRTQCELERLPEFDSRRPPLEREVRRLLREHGKEWLQPLKQAKFTFGWKFRRGFPEEVKLSARRFVVVAEDLFQVAPLVRSIHFPDASNEVTALADCPYLARLTEVDLGRMCACGSCHIHRELRDLFASPHVANLRMLRVSNDRIEAEGARQLATSKHLSRLEALDVSGNPLGPGGVRALVAPQKAFPRLARLDLSRTDLGAVGIQALVEASRWNGLTSLALRDNKIGPAGAKALSAWPGLAGLTVLDLRENDIGASGAKALAASPHLENLARLDLRDNVGRLGEDAARTLQHRFGKRVKLS